MCQYVLYMAVHGFNHNFVACLSIYCSISQDFSPKPVEHKPPHEKKVSMINNNSGGMGRGSEGDSRGTGRMFTY